MDKNNIVGVLVVCTCAFVLANRSRCVFNEHRSTVSCRGENWTQIPYEFLQEKSFHTLDLGVNNITSLADTSKFFELPTKDRIETIYLDHNQISELPRHVFDALSNLKFLDLSNNNLKHVPRSLCHLTSLTGLVLDENPIESISKNAFRCLRNLKFLSLGNTKLRGLPVDFLKDSNLQELYLYGNTIENMHEIIFPATLRIVNREAQMTPEHPIHNRPDVESNEISI